MFFDRNHLSKVNKHEEIDMTSTAPYVRLYTDDDGESHFQDMEATLNPTDYAPPAPLLDVSEAIVLRPALFGKD
ncbi:MAG: hypothetical protein BECKG1743D_GA0114223_107422 [Candidatus Kentron sp. G]|nr:MAG: hypothetical protein BECKG1743D_GA0114223_107422 [Candidatus Kentron sp. G]